MLAVLPAVGERLQEMLALLLRRGVCSPSESLSWKTRCSESCATRPGCRHGDKGRRSL